jgi:hypothetical protein
MDGRSREVDPGSSTAGVNSLTSKGVDTDRRDERTVDGTVDGRWIMGGVALLFVAVVSPIVLRGAPLADDFHNCLEPQRVGLTSFLADSAQRLGAIRPARFLEIFITNGVCEHLPFGFAIIVPLALTLVVAVLLRGLLRDLDVPSPWPEIAAAVWLLQPLGTESALWPAALHVPLGLGLALAALRLYRAGHHAWGALAVAGAALSVEQVILALPFAVWLVVPPEHRRAALASSLVPVVLVLVSFGLWTGTDMRLRASLAERLPGLIEDPLFYIEYPANGMGLHSIPLGIVWGFPLSVGVVGIGALIGARLGPRVLRSATERLPVRGVLLATVGLVILVNVPVVLAVPREGSPRLFAPTWLVLSGLLPVMGSRLSLRRKALLGAVAGSLAAGALLSLALSVHVRDRSAEFAAAASMSIADRAPDGAVVAVCGIRRTVVEPAPRGAFAVHEFIYRWSARDALEYYTGRQATFVLAGKVWGSSCPDPSTVDLVVRFPELVRETT